MKLPKWLKRPSAEGYRPIGHRQYELNTASECPSCRANLDGATKFDGPSGGPHPGDLSICWYCSAMLEFGPKLKLRLIPSDVWDNLPADIKQQLLAAAEIAQQTNGPAGAGESKS